MTSQIPQLRHRNEIRFRNNLETLPEIFALTQTETIWSLLAKIEDRFSSQQPPIKGDIDILGNGTVMLSNFDMQPTPHNAFRITFELVGIGMLREINSPSLQPLIIFKKVNDFLDAFEPFNNYNSLYGPYTRLFAQETLLLANNLFGALPPTFEITGHQDSENKSKDFTFTRKYPNQLDPRFVKIPYTF